MTRSRLGMLTLGFAVNFGWAASPAQATSVTIQNVTVTSTVGVDTRTWCMIGCVLNGTGGDLWAAYANTVVSSPSSGGTQSLVLTQNPTATVPGFNFDTSEHVFNDGSVTSCGQSGGGLPTCVMSLSILTNLFGLVIVPLPLNNALNNFNTDSGGSNYQEAANWTQVLNQIGGLSVFIGYADNANTGGCADLTGTISGNCLPDNPWQGSPNTIFAGMSTGGAGCSVPGITSCFDAGAIRIDVNDPPSPTPVPEPATMTLLATGLAALVARRQRRANAARRE